MLPHSKRLPINKAVPFTYIYILLVCNTSTNNIIVKRNRRCLKVLTFCLCLDAGGYHLRKEVSRIIWKQMLAIFLCYFVTLSIYPGVLTDLVSPRFGTWMPVLVMTVFNLFDLMGKVMRALSVQ